MIEIKELYIDEKVLLLIKEKQLLNQYLKAEKYLLEWNIKQVSLKIRQPKNKNIYYFRLNKQFRLWCTLIDWVIKIFHLDNHQ